MSPASTVTISAQPGPQIEFLQTAADICIYGGAAGGGKTVGLILEPLRHVGRVANFTAVFFRRTTPQITNPGALWDETLNFYPRLGGTPHLGAREWRWPRAGKIKFAHLQFDRTVSATLPLDQLSSEEIEDTMTMLSELGITVTESDESEEPAAPEGEPAKARGNLDHDDIGRTDDPVRMYLREMRSVQLLSREGEVAIAKRIEAGREMMLGAIRDTPLTFDAILGWRDALAEGKMLLRDIIDLDATYGSGGFGAVPAEVVVAVAEPVVGEPGNGEGGPGRLAQIEAEPAGAGADRQDGSTPPAAI